MAVNQWLNSPSTSLNNEVNVLQDLIDENIAACGVDVQYIPKKQLNLNVMFGESTEAIYKEGFDIEMYISDIQRFNGDGDLYSKFQITSTDSATLIVSKRRFPQESKKVDQRLTVPIQGDLIYMPLNKSMWEIRKVKLDESFFQFGSGYTFRIECSLYQPSHEEFVDNSFNDNFNRNVSTSDDGIDVLLGINLEDLQDESVQMAEIANSNSPDLNFDPENPFGGA